MTTLLRPLLASSLALAAVLAGCTKAEKPAAATSTAAAAPTPAPADVALSSDEQKVSYGIGHNIGSNLARQPGLALDRAALVAGMEDALAGRELRVAEADLDAAFGAVQAKAQAAATEQAAATLAAGNAYLDQNKARPGVKVTESGLQYEVLKSGGGDRKPAATDTVEVHYHGSLIDGTVFDSSVDRGETATFPLNQVIRGWTEALQLMSVGDKYRLVLPAAIAYGPRATGKIPANSTLVFDVELIDIKPKEEPAEAPAAAK